MSEPTPENKLKKMFGDGPSPFEQMINLRPPDKIVREEDGEEWHYWKVEDDD